MYGLRPIIMEVFKMLKILPYSLQQSLLTRKPDPFLMSVERSSNNVTFGDTGGHAIYPRRRLIPVTVTEL